MAGKPKESVKLHLRDFDIIPNQHIIIGIRAVDSAGNMGLVQTTKVKVAGTKPKFILPDSPDVPKASRADQLPRVGDLRVFVIDSLDKVDPFNGKIIPNHNENYKLANHLWSTSERQIRLFAAKNETVSFQLVLRGKTDGVKASLIFGQADISSELFSFRYIKGEKGRLFPDPLVPVDSLIQIPYAAEKLSKQKYASLIADVHIPKTTETGLYRGKVTIINGQETLDLNIHLTVWDFSLPNQLSFVPQMNGYGRVPEKEYELEYYRLAHKHRTCLNILPYSWTGRIVDGRGPKWDGKDFKWQAYDKRFGPLLDGSAFADLPRGPVPVEAFYLPINENWPISIHDNFNGGYWIEDAIKPEYRKDFVIAVSKFAEHFSEKGWDQTMFEFYLNNKITHKKKSWKSSSAPWNFDEPVNTQDFWALRWYGLAFHEGVGDSHSAKMVFRADISRPQWQRDILDGILDVNVVGGTYRRYKRLIHDRKSIGTELIYTYGSANSIERSNFQPVGWCLESWLNGLDGVVPWQTLGRERSWKSVDYQALFYPGKFIDRPGPIPSIRLKAFRRGQQDAEYLEILAAETEKTHKEMSEIILPHLQLSGDFLQKQQSDAGQVLFQGLNPVSLWRLRTSVGRYLSKKPRLSGDFDE